MNNNAAVNEPCANCGTRTDPQCGPEIMMVLDNGYHASVCYACENQAPTLVTLRNALQSVHNRNPELYVKQNITESMAQSLMIEFVVGLME